jgi:hypothetical protein
MLEIFGLTGMRGDGAGGLVSIWQTALGEAPHWTKVQLSRAVSGERKDEVKP